MPGDIRAGATFLNSCPRVTASDQLKTCSAELPCKSARRYIYKAPVSVPEAFLRRISFPGRKPALAKHCRNLATYIPDRTGADGQFREITVFRWHCIVASIGFQIARRTENLTSLSLFTLSKIWDQMQKSSREALP